MHLRIVIHIEYIAPPLGVGGIHIFKIVDEIYSISNAKRILHDMFPNSFGILNTMNLNAKFK